MTASSGAPDASGAVLNNAESASGGPPVELTDLTYRYAKAGEPAVNGLGLTLRPGTITGLLGRNGSGKTTLLSLIAGLRRPTSGSLTIAGRPAFDDDAAMTATAFLGGPRSLLEDVPTRRSL